jgi:MSHA pilin protein MshC
MVELVVVIVLVGILGAVAAARYFDGSSFDASAYAEQTKAMLRYAQKTAVAQHRPVFVVFSPKRIALCFNFRLDPACSPANRVQPPSGSNRNSAATAAQCGAANWYCEGTPDNLAYSRLGAGAGDAYFLFDALGRPLAAADPVGAEAPGFAPLVLRIAGDGRNRDLTVTPESGYVYGPRAPARRHPDRTNPVHRHRLGGGGRRAAGDALQ